MGYMFREMSSRRAIGSLVLVACALLVFAFVAPSSQATIVSLGDSYASGEGADDYDTGTRWNDGNGCHRSGHAWPRLLGVAREHHFACSGALTENFLFTPQKTGSSAGADVFPQALRLKHLAQSTDISKVYVTIGGNDLGFERIIRDCVVTRPGGCLKKLEAVEFPRLDDFVLPRVITLLAWTKAYSNGADVALVGYPNVVSSRSKCFWMQKRERSQLLRLQDRLEDTLSRATRAAGVSFVSVSNALAGHELCTRSSWVMPIGKNVIGRHRKDLFRQQAHPNRAGQRAIAAEVRRKEKTGAGVVPPPPPGCTRANNVAAIIDDSGSMHGSDPYNLRSSAMQLLITKPNGLLRTLGAVEFGTSAAQLFSPSLVAFSQKTMLAALSGLQADGVDGEDSTDYNAAFSLASNVQSDADARIFFTDGEHNEDIYMDGHRGGPRTYVVGLGIGPGGTGNEASDQLRRIAAETGGHYFPLLRYDGESVEAQTKRIQPVFNAIDALLQCRTVPDQFNRTLSPQRRRSTVITSPFVGSDALEVVISWADPNARVRLGSATVTGRGGKVVASLSGRTPRRSKRGAKKKQRMRKVNKLQVAEVSGIAYTTVKVSRPPKGSRLNLTVKSKTLPGSTDVSVQIGPIAETIPAVPPDVTPPPKTNNHPQQVTPNHGVNTFTNYHNASGMGPPISAGTWVEVSCRVHDPFIASVNPDGWWYRIASPPWNDRYYSPANVFMNGDPYGGPYTRNTDFSVPVC
jgi:hypothetical protein